jgi:hypothetical protein
MTGIRTRLVIRYLLLANGTALAAIAGLYAGFGSRPAGLVVGGVLGVAAIGLWLAIPLTDPYRSDHSSW